MAIKTRYNEAIRLLILHDSQDEAEQLINELRNFGHATRAHQIEDEEDLLDVLNGGVWDLFLSRPETKQINVSTVLTHLKKLNKDIPLIILSDDNDSETITSGLQAGAQDVVPAKERERLKLVVTRELNNLYDRRLRHKSEQALAEVDKRCTLLLDSSRDAITYVHDGMHIYANDAYVEMFGYENRDDIEGLPIMDMIAALDKDKFKEFLRNYNQDDQTADLACHGVTTANEEIHLKMNFSPASYDGEPCTQIILRLDKGNEELEAKLKELSSQDVNTGLFNRTYFIDKLDQCIAGIGKSNSASALSYIHLDDFNKIKTSIGIGGTDQLTKQIADLLKKVAPEPDMASRFSDDTFALLQAKASKEKATQLAEKVRQALEVNIFKIGNMTLQLTASIGIALIEKNDTPPNSSALIARAHEASNQAWEKTQGNSIALYIKQEHAEEADLTFRIEKALNDGTLKLLFQPVISMRGETQELYEVLLRMQDDEGNLVSAGEFLATADQAGFSEKIDRWVIIEATKVLAKHVAEGHDTRLFINLTVKSLQNQEFLPWLEKVFKAADIPTHSVIFQLSENDINSYLDHAKTFNGALKKLHSSIAISRFGAANSPFNTLKHVQPEFLKLHPQFIDNLEEEGKKETLKEFIQYAHKFELQTIIPFVESAALLSTLWPIGAHYVQGHYLQSPAEKMDYEFSEEQ